MTIVDISMVPVCRTPVYLGELLRNSLPIMLQYACCRTNVPNLYNLELINDDKTDRENSPPSEFIAKSADFQVKNNLKPHLNPT